MRRVARGLHQPAGNTLHPRAPGVRKLTDKAQILSPWIDAATVLKGERNQRACPKGQRSLVAEADPVSLRAGLLELPRDVAAQLMADVLGAMMAEGRRAQRISGHYYSRSPIRPPSMPIGRVNRRLPSLCPKQSMPDANCSGS
jgi:hypothetical protein